jgi:hypothetical protein
MQHIHAFMCRNAFTYTMHTCVCKSTQNMFLYHTFMHVSSTHTYTHTHTHTQTHTHVQVHIQHIRIFFISLLSAHQHSIHQVRNGYVQAHVLVRQFDYLLIAVIEHNRELSVSRVICCDSAVVPLSVIVKHLYGITDLLMRAALIRVCPVMSYGRSAGLSTCS